MEEHEPDHQLSTRRFRIYVAGRLDLRFIEGIDGVELGHSDDGSTLDGTFVDQSHLRGVLDRLWQLGIEVLKFETYLADNPPSQAAEPTPLMRRKNRIGKTDGDQKRQRRSND